MIHTDWIIHLYFFVCKLSWTCEEDSQFSPQLVLVAMLRFWNTSVLDFCVVSVIWSVWVHGSFYGFNLWIGPGLVFEHCS
jgi:hypothetical protein